MRGHEAAIDLPERTASAQIRPRSTYRHLLTVSGIGKVLAATILLETGPIERFAAVGNYASAIRQRTEMTEPPVGVPRCRQALAASDTEERKAAGLTPG